jgi:hypothetical protein
VTKYPPFERWPYRIERLQKLTGNIREIASGNKYPGLIEEIILVWNGPYELSNITETEDGLELVEMHNDPNNPVRIWYPFQHGLPNNLWNRYHPYIQPKSEAILYFDDDGPFFSPRAVMAGFELWKRHSDTQIGTLARENHLDQRQMKEKQLKITLSDKVRLGREFISTCRNQGDWIEYDYHDFPFFGAQMVLPSGSFLHRNYLCYLWHPALDIIRHFIRNHPVRPDDITVSSIITQLSGNAPRVYPSRVFVSIIRLNCTRMNSALAGSNKQVLIPSLVAWTCCRKASRSGTLKAIKNLSESSSEARIMALMHFSQTRSFSTGCRLRTRSKGSNLNHFIQLQHNNLTVAS